MGSLISELFAMISDARRLRLRRRLQWATQLVAVLVGWQLRSAERTYAPGGAGYAAASEEFHLLTPG